MQKREPQPALAETAISLDEEQFQQKGEGKFG
jgi:hypothetical protein